MPRFSNRRNPALFPLLTNLAGHAGDVATGTGTIAYATPKGLVAPVVAA